MTLRELLLEFSKGCSNGGPGECEACLQHVVRAINRIKEKEEIAIESSDRVGNLEVIHRIYK